MMTLQLTKWSSMCNNCKVYLDLNCFLASDTTINPAAFFIKKLHDTATFESLHVAHSPSKTDDLKLLKNLSRERREEEFWGDVVLLYLPIFENDKISS